MPLAEGTHFIDCRLALAFIIEFFVRPPVRAVPGARFLFIFASRWPAITFVSQSASETFWFFETTALKISGILSVECRTWRKSPFRKLWQFAFCLFIYPQQTDVLSGQIWEMRKIYFRHYDASLQVTAGRMCAYTAKSICLQNHSNLMIHKALSSQTASHQVGFRAGSDSIPKILQIFC